MEKFLDKLAEVIIWTVVITMFIMFILGIGLMVYENHYTLICIFFVLIMIWSRNRIDKKNYKDSLK